MRAPQILALLVLPLALTACPDDAGSAGPTTAEEAPAFVNRIPALPEGALDLSVTVGDAGYEPSSLSAPPSETVVVAFTRTSESECGRYVQVLDTDTQAELPLNETVKIPIEMPESGEVTFACGMDMMRGTIKVVAVDGPPAEVPGEAPAEEKAG